MARIGLALSGGGFRAVLYHLGVIRFLRDSQVLPKITHITSVSGGSVLGAHLVLNWERYTGDDAQFQQVADELLEFLRLDVRNRIVRRFPLGSALNAGRRLFRQPALRQYTRAGLLEQHYERHLYGDTALFQLPDRPRLHILATNLSEGCLCSFYRGGLLLQQRTPGRLDRFERVEVGLATVPMAVAASSAFPGFFPPLELSGPEIGANAGEFVRQAFTDGGIYDNLGLRMFRCMEQSWIRDMQPLNRDDVLDPTLLETIFSTAEGYPADSPLGRLSQLISFTYGLEDQTPNSIPDQRQSHRLLDRLSVLIRNGELYKDPAFHQMELANDAAQSLLQYLVHSDQEPRSEERSWLNRQIIESTLQQVTGKPCLRPRHQGFDQILVSNAGAKFKVKSDGRASGLIRTALRSTDILMDRVNQLELESFHNAPGVVFFPIDAVISSGRDRHAPHPEVQRRAALIRTDMDRFSDLEASALIQHGYCVARQVCEQEKLTHLTRADWLPPWDPLEPPVRPGMAQVRHLAEPSGALKFARQLQRSASRRVWSTLFSLRDWPTYFWIPVILITLLSVPLLLQESRERAARHETVLSAIRQTSPLYEQILESLERQPITELPAVPFEDVQELHPMDFSGIEALTDDRIYDLRGLFPAGSSASDTVHSYVRLKLRRQTADEESSVVRLQTSAQSDQLRMAWGDSDITPRFLRVQQPDKRYLWEMQLDLSDTPVQSVTTIDLETLLTGEFASSNSRRGQFEFKIFADTGVANIWMLMPTGSTFRDLRITGSPLADPSSSEVVVPTSSAELPAGSIQTFQLIKPSPAYRYRCQWRWGEN